MQIKSVDGKIKITRDTADDPDSPATTWWLSVPEAMSLVGESGPKGYYLSVSFQEALAEARHAAEETFRRRIAELESEAANLRKLLLNGKAEKSPLMKAVTGEAT